MLFSFLQDPNNKKASEERRRSLIEKEVRAFSEIIREAVEKACTTPLGITGPMAFFNCDTAGAVQSYLRKIFLRSDYFEKWSKNNKSDEIEKMFEQSLVLINDKNVNDFIQYFHEIRAQKQAAESVDKEMCLAKEKPKKFFIDHKQFGEFLFATTIGDKVRQEDVGLMFEDSAPAAHAKTALEVTFSLLRQDLSREKSLKAEDENAEKKVEHNTDDLIGSTACVTYVGPDGEVFIGNVGDSRACLFVRTPQNEVIAKRLTCDQKPETLLEASRIERVSGLVFMGGLYRICTIQSLNYIAVGRSFTCPKERTMDCTPDIMQYHLNAWEKEYPPGSEFFIMIGSDGCFDRNEQAIARALKKVDPKDWAITTIREGYKFSRDNITCIFLKIKKYEKTKVFGVFDR